MYLSAFLSVSRGGRPRASSPTATFSITVSHGKRAKDWNTIAVRVFTPFSGRPPTRTVPAEGRSTPVTMRRIVLLPQPEGPTRERNSPSRTSRSMGPRMRILSP